jgi:DNA-binding transcriptional regulator GbsR (MarR family)
MIPNPEDADGLFFDATAELGKLLGLSKSASLALAVLFTTDEPLSLDEVAAHTSIAKSSISVILKNLEQMGLTEVIDKPHDRRKYYKVVDNPGEAVAALVARRLDHLTGRQQEALALKQAAFSAQQKERLDQLISIYQGLIQIAAFLHARRADAWADMRSCLKIDTLNT